MEYSRNVNADGRYKPLVRHEKKLTTRPIRTTNYPMLERKEMRREASQEPPEFVIPTRNQY